MAGADLLFFSHGYLCAVVRRRAQRGKRERESGVRAVSFWLARGRSTSVEVGRLSSRHRDLMTRRGPPSHRLVRKGVPVRSYVRDLRYVRARGARVRARVDGQAGPRPPDRGARRRRDRPRADLRRQEVRRDGRPARAAGGARVRARGGRDRGAHPRPARADRARHAQHDPRAVRARDRGAQPRRPDPRRLKPPGGSDGPARRRAAGAVCADGAHLHA